MLKVIGRYGFTSEKQIHVVCALRSYLHGFVTLKISNSFGLDVDMDERFSLGYKAMLDGLDLR